jgi:acyl-CoA synthetase (AMP-forming)/AMP-acid ligase II
MIQFSSGSTVDPKPVVLSHRQLLAQTAILIGMIRDTVRDEQPTGLSWLPLYHDMGLIGCVFPALCHPSRLTLIPPENFLARPALWLRGISRQRAHVCPAPAFAYALCTERIRDEELEGCDLSSWKMALNGAEPISAGAARAFSARFARWGLSESAMTPVYGLSEAALAVSFGTIREPFRSTRFQQEALRQGRALPVTGGQAGEQAVELVSVGPPLPRFAVQIRDRGDQPLPEGWIGRIYASGPSVMTATSTPGARRRPARSGTAGWTPAISAT